MLSLHTAHPSLDLLSDLRRASAMADHDNARPIDIDAQVAAHVASCAVCQQSLASLESLANAALQLSGPVASDALRARVMTSAAAGATMEATIATTIASRIDTTTASPNAAVTRARRRWAPIGAVLAALLAVAVVSLLTTAPDVEAGGTAGTMVFSTTTPRNGERVTVRYRPGPLLGRFSQLRLRARVRTIDAASYAAGVPVITVGELARAKDGTYMGAFTLPDSIVFASLAVEDSAATEIDDQGGRTWELSRADAEGKVTYAALEQRANDLMGRNWEEITSTAQRMVAEYPDDLRAWSWLRASQSWRGVPVDSINAFHRARETAFDKSLRAQPSLTGATIGQMYWYARGLDSTGKAYWRDRLMREAPNNSFAIQNRVFETLDKLRNDHDTTTALRTFDGLWNSAPRDRRDQVVNYTMSIAISTRDSAVIRRWTDRLLAESLQIPQPSSIRRVATDFVGIPSLHAEGLDRLRAELARLASAAPKHRPLDETGDDYRARLDRSTRATYAALGRALVRDGQHRAALDTLALAAASGWDVDVFRAVREANLVAGDTAGAVTMSARLAVDPRTSPERSALLAAFAIGRIGTVAWNATLAAQRREFIDRTLARAHVKTIARPVNVTALDGSAQELRTMTKGEVTVVAFWSRFCGPAIEVIPRLHQVATRLGESGIRTVTILEETRSSPSLTAFLKSHDFTLPVLLDAKGEASAAFNQWGTPYFYVLDAQGRIVFEPTSDLEQLLVNAEAVRLAGLITDS